MFVLAFFLGAIVIIAIEVHLPGTKDMLVFIVGQDKSSLIYDLFQGFYVRLIASLSAPLVLSNVFLVVMCVRYKRLEEEVYREYKGWE